MDEDQRPPSAADTHPWLPREIWLVPPEERPAEPPPFTNFNPTEDEAAKTLPDVLKDQ